MLRRGQAAIAPRHRDVAAPMRLSAQVLARGMVAEGAKLIYSFQFIASPGRFRLRDHYMRAVMTRTDLAPIPTDELWALHEEIATALAARLTAEMRVIENRLLQLDGRGQTKQLRQKMAADPIRQFSRNSRIRSGRRKLGRGGESNRVG
jgi:hypothetical protein